MRIIIKHILFSLLIFSCNNQEKKKVDEVSSNYLIHTQGIKVAWTAYKFTDKVGVKGVFDDFELITKSNSGTIETLLKDSRISIKTKSVNSKSDIRDTKLRDVFFKTFNTKTIEGEILKVTSGNGILLLNMNNQVKEIDYDYKLKLDTLIVNTNLNLTKWKAKKALDTLNNVCYDLHKGTNGVSKLWPDVSVQIKIPLTKIN